MMPILDIVGQLKKAIGEEQELLDAARTGNLAIVEKIFSGKQDKGRKSTVALGQKLSSLWRSVNVNFADRAGYTALHHAAVNGYRDIVEVLLKADAQPGLKDQQGCTPVHLAAWKGDAEIVMQLLKSGTEAEPGMAPLIEPVHVNHQNNSGDTALHSAAQYGHVAVVDVLLQKGANPTIRNLNEETPLDLAAQYGRLDVVKLLLITHPELNQRPANTPSPLHLASRNGHKDVVALLLEKHFNIQTLTESGTALHEAALHGKLDVVQLLLERGIDVTKTDQKGMTALQLLSEHQSLQKSYTEIMQTIKDHIDRNEKLYETLAICQSGFDKPTAAVKPLPPEQECQSKIPSPQLSPVAKQVPPSQPFKHRVLEKPNEPLKPLKPAWTGNMELLDAATPSSPDRLTSPELSPEPKHVSLWAKSLSEKVDNTTGLDAAPPPLPPRYSTYACDDKSSAALAPEFGSLEKSLSSKVIPKKPPRQGRSPAPVRHAQPNISPTGSVSLSPSPLTNPNLATTEHIPDIMQVDLLKSEQSDIDDHCDAGAIAHDIQPVPLSTVDPVMANKPALAETCYVEMTSAVSNQCQQRNSSPSSRSEKPISEVKPMLKADKKPQLGIDNYALLFPNFNKSEDKVNKPDSRRMNTGSLEFDVQSEVSSEKQKVIEQKSILHQNNSAAGESIYLAMNVQGDPIKNIEYVKENEYSEISDVSNVNNSHKTNIYSTISETKQEVEGNIYSQINDHSCKSFGTGGDNIAEDSEDMKNVSEKPNCLDFMKSKPKAPLTPTGYVQPPTPDFPPPSPATAMLGIENKIKQIFKFDETPLVHDDKAMGTLGTVILANTNPETLSVQDELTELQEIDARHNEQIENIQKNNSDSKETGKAVKSNQITVDHCIGSSNTHATIDGESYISVIKVDTKVTPKSSIPMIDTIKLDTKVIPESFISITDTAGSENIYKTQSETAKSAGKLLLARKSGAKTVAEVPIREVKKESTVACLNIKTDSANRFETPEKVGEVRTENPEVKSHANVESIINGGKLADIQNGKSTNIEKAEVKPEKEAECVERGAEAIGDSINTNLESNQLIAELRVKSSNPDMDIFKGLLRGSTVGALHKQSSKFYSDVLLTNATRKQENQSSIKLIEEKHMEKEEDIDINEVMKSIEVEVAQRASCHDSSPLDDSEEWAKIQDIMASCGCGIARESVFIRDYEQGFTKLLAGSSPMSSVGEWLESIGMGQYENAFVANGFDNVDFLDSKVLEEQDLEQIGVLSHDHRQRILKEARSLPQMKPIDTKNQPSSVQEWLMSMQLLEYLDTFWLHGYDTMDKVQSILWELQLRTVLDISMLGHRKRILASLGERMPEKQNTQKKRSISPEEKNSPFQDINLFKDYSGVKPLNLSLEDETKGTSQMVVDNSSEEVEVFKKPGGQSIRNSSIHLRPPHLAQTSSPARQWRHKPEKLIKGSCNYTAQYLGSSLVPELSGGTDSTRAGITKLKKSADVLAKIPIIMLSISYKGVTFIDAKSKRVICVHEIGNIFCACQDTEHLNFFAYITRDIETSQHYCHVFSVKSSSWAHDIILTLGESFEVAYQMALKEKSMQEALELDRKMSQSDAEDTQSASYQFSTSSV